MLDVAKLVVATLVWVATGIAPPVAIATPEKEFELELPTDVRFVQVAAFVKFSK